MDIWMSVCTFCNKSQTQRGSMELLTQATEDLTTSTRKYRWVINARTFWWCAHFRKGNDLHGCLREQKKKKKLIFCKSQRKSWKMMFTNIWFILYGSDYVNALSWQIACRKSKIRSIFACLWTSDTTVKIHNMYITVASQQLTSSC